jgi:hypothetical protein
MAQIIFNQAAGIIGISGRIGPLIFYRRNGKQFVRTSDKSIDLRSIIESCTSHLRLNYEPSTGVMAVSLQINKPHETHHS